MSSVEMPQAETKDSTATTNLPTTCLEQALKSRDPRISVLPIRGDGSKSPAVPSWKQYQKRLYTTELEGDWTFLGNGVQ